MLKDSNTSTFHSFLQLQLQPQRPLQGMARHFLVGSAEKPSDDGKIRRKPLWNARSIRW